MAKKVLHLRKRKTILIDTISPFNFEGTFFKPSHFPSKLVQYNHRKLYHGIKVNNRIFGLVISDVTQLKSKSCIKVEVYSDSLIENDVIEDIKCEIISRYDLDSDISEFIKKYQNDKLLKLSMKQLSGMRPSISYSLYSFLMVTVVLQNATVRRSVQMMDDLFNCFGTKIIYAEHEIFVTWLPKDIKRVSEETLRDLKLGYRAKTIKRISEHFSAGLINEYELRKITDRQIVKEELLNIYGVGPQSVSYILFEAFHFYDTLDHISPWESRICSMLMFGHKKASSKKIIDVATKRWGSWRMLAIHYLFEYAFWCRKNKSVPWLEEEIRL